MTLGDATPVHGGGSTRVPVRTATLTHAQTSTGLIVAMSSDGSIRQYYADGDIASGDARGDAAESDDDVDSIAVGSVSSSRSRAGSASGIAGVGASALAPPLDAPDALPASAFLPWPAWLPEVSRSVSGPSGDVERVLSVPRAARIAVGGNLARASCTLTHTLCADSGTKWALS